MAASSLGLVGIQFMAYAAEHCWAVTQSVPVEAQFLEKSNTDLVAPKDIEGLMLFVFSDPSWQAPELEESAS